MVGRKKALVGVRAIAFDAYGTIIDFQEEDFIAAFAEILGRQGLQGDASRLWRLFLRAAYRIRNENHEFPTYLRFQEAWAWQFKEAFARLRLKGDPYDAALYLKGKLADALAHPDARPVLEALRPHFQLALLSNADDDFLGQCLARNGIHFDIIVTSEQAGALKPDPAIFIYLLKRLGLSAAEAAYVGDNPVPDILGAKRAGMKAVWLDRVGRRRPRRVPAPDLKISALSELLDFVPIAHG